MIAWGEITTEWWPLRIDVVPLAPELQAALTQAEAWYDSLNPEERQQFDQALEDAERRFLYGEGADGE